MQANVGQRISDRQAAKGALNTARLDKAGSTVASDLQMKGKLTLDADDADVKFDHWATFTRWVQPYEGSSPGWDNLGYALKSTEGLANFYVPSRAIVGAELVRGRSA